MRIRPFESLKKKAHPRLPKMRTRPFDSLSQDDLFKLRSIAMKGLPQNIPIPRNLSELQDMIFASVKKKKREVFECDPSPRFISFSYHESGVRA